MFVSKLEPDKGELQIVFDVQWETPENDHDKAKIIGIVDTPDTYLDWNTFKSYLIQNSGNMNFTTDDIKILYLDFDDDLIPIDSEIEFREFLKFSRRRARRGRNVVMKVNMISNGGAKLKEPLKLRDDYLPKNSKPKLFCLKKQDLGEKILGKHNVSFEKSCGSDASSNRDVIPEWFESYMMKFKAELVQEVTAAVVAQVTHSSNAHGHNRRSLLSDYTKLHYPIIEKRKKKKKMHEEDSSDCTDGLQLHWDDKPELPRHLQKITKREKKYEKKLDVKLEKLESKTKKIMEKKSHLFTDRALDLKRSKAKKTLMGSRMTCGDLVMNAMSVDEYNYELHVQKGQVVVQTWEVMNNGQFPWTEETELRYAWGSKSLMPLTTVVKCPHLECGEAGTVEVSLQAPLFIGNYESYWYFHHQGHRFGHWLGCTVIVDPEQRTETPEAAQATCSVTAVDLTMKCPAYARSLSTERMSLSPKPAEQVTLPDHVPPHELIEVYEKIIENEMANLVIGEKAGDDLTASDHTYALSERRPGKLVDPAVGAEDAKPSEFCPTFSEIDRDAGHDVCEKMTQNEPAKGQFNADHEQSKLDKLHDPEYVSGSSSDDMSILSGTVSVDDTEPSDEFVLVPMPACFSFSKSLHEEANPITQPISVEIPEGTPEAVQASDNNNNMQLKDFPELPIFLPINPNLTDSRNQESGYSEGENDENICPAKSEAAHNLTPDDAYTVYGKDNFGKSVPVARVVKQKDDDDDQSQARADRRQDKEVPRQPQQPQQPQQPRSFPNSPPSATPPPHFFHHCYQNFHEANCHPKPEGFVYEAEMKFPMHCGPHQPKHPNFRGPWQCQYSYGCAPNIHTEQPRSSKYSYVYDKREGHSSQSSRRSTSTDSRDFSPVAAAVNILPETLVTGATNAAMSAINTARTVMDMLRPRHEDVVTGHWEEVPPQFEESLKKLSEMGFQNRALNISLLKKFGNNLQKVVFELLK